MQREEVSTTVGFTLPGDFDTPTFDTLNQRISQGMGPTPEWRVFAAAWSAIAYRFVSAAQSDEAWTSSITVSREPLPDARLVQEQALFAFFMNSVSSIECFFYAAHALAAAVKPQAFPMTTRDDMWLNAKKVRERFQKEFPGESLAQEMEKCLDDTVWKDLSRVRNVLAHRIMFPRMHYRGGPRDRMVTIPTNVDEPAGGWRFDLSLDAGTTQSPRRWLARALTRLFAATGRFCDDHF